MDVRKAFHLAEEQYHRGDFEDAFHAYRDLLMSRMQAGAGSQSPVTALDVVAMERLANLAVLYGFYAPAADLLQAMRSWFARSSNLYSADFTALKLASVYIAQGLIRHAYEILLNLNGAPNNIENLEFTDSALTLWESGHCWIASPAEMSLIFSRLYLEMAHILSANGQYRSALAAAGRGLQHVDISQLESSFQAKPALHLVIAAAKLESGDLVEAKTELDRLDACLQSPIFPAIIVRRDELLGKLNLLTG